LVKFQGQGHGSEFTARGKFPFPEISVMCALYDVQGHNDGGISVYIPPKSVYVKNSGCAQRNTFIMHR